MRRVLLASILILLTAATGCSSALTHGDVTADDAHAFRLHTTQVTEKINGTSAPEEKAFLVIKYEVENLGTAQDARRQWTDQMKLELDDEVFEPVQMDPLEGEMWSTTLAAGQAETGYVAFVVPDDVDDFKLTVTLPESDSEEIFEFRPADRRIGVNADFVITRLEQIERTKRIPVIGGVLASFSSAPVRYLGTILVPEDEIPDLLERTSDLSEEARKDLVKDYLREHGQGELE